jgi:hypothetical protein
MNKDLQPIAERQAGIEAISMLCDVLLLLGKKSIYIPDYIKENAKTRRVPKLVKEFENLKNDKRFYFSRTSEIFHKSTGELRRMPMINGYWMSHIYIA